MFCGKCGANTDDSAVFCGSCGALIKSEDKVVPTKLLEQPDYSIPLPGADLIQTVPKKAGIAPLIAILVLVVVASVGVIWFLLGRSVPELQNTAMPEDIHINEELSQEEPEHGLNQETKPLGVAISNEVPENNMSSSEEPASTPAAELEVPLATASSNDGQTALVANPTYLFFDDTDFNIYCAYPSHFIEQTSSSADVRLSLRSPDGRTTMSVLASYNSSGITVQQAMREFTDSVGGGKVSYEAHGDTWFAMSIDKGEYVYYRKAFVENADIYCFDFSCPLDELYVYEGYVEYIEDNFKHKSGI